MRPLVNNEETIDRTLIGALVWDDRKAGAGTTGCTRDRVERQVMDRIVETGGRCCLVADSRIGCSRQKATPTGMASGNRWVAARYTPVLDFRIDLLSPGRHGEKLGLKLRQAVTLNLDSPSASLLRIIPCLGRLSSGRSTEFRCLGIERKVTAIPRFRDPYV